MYYKKYKQPFFEIVDVQSDVIVMSGTGFDSNNFDNEITEINWTGGGLG